MTAGPIAPVHTEAHVADPPRHGTRRGVRWWVYPVALGVVWATWLLYMTFSGSWDLFSSFWPASVTMAGGSFVAGATAEGGAAVAFPVFTKVLHIAATDARTFGLMIQSVGMVMAGVFIVSRGIPFLPRVVGWVSLGAAFGQVGGTMWVQLGSPASKILFTFVATAFGIAMAIARWWLRWEPFDHIPGWTTNRRLVFVVVGIFGGIFASNTGSGADMATFVVLVLAFGINEKVGTPTTVIIMAINSVIGFALHGLVLGDIGVAWDYWLVAAPIVAVGAPLGAYAASRAPRDAIIVFLLTLIGVELLTTIFLVPFTTQSIILIGAATALCVLLFTAMLRFRRSLMLAALTAAPPPDAAPPVLSPVS